MRSVTRVTRLATVVALTIGASLVGAAPAAFADAPESDSPSSTQLAETGAGDRALIGLGIVGGVLLVGGSAVFALTVRRNTEH